MAKRRSKLKKKRFKRICLVTVFCLAINAYLIYSIGSIFGDVTSMREEKKNLNKELTELKEEEDILKSEVNKLKDPVYIAKYAREKFLYSGNDEYIIRMK